MKTGSVASTVVLAVVVIACGGSTGTVSNVSAQQACTDFGSAVCGAVDACSPALVQLQYGGISTCQMRAQTTCSTALGANGTGMTPDTMEACAKALSGDSCANVVSNNPPGACNAVAGQLANGMPCGDPSQCQSQYCNTGTDGTCGACGTRAGATCVRDADCNYGQLCVGTPKTCVAPGMSGASCDDNHPCNKTLACKGGACAAPDEAGGTCVIGNANNVFGSCDSLKGLYCGLTKTCQAIAFASAGQPCGVKNGVLTACAANGTCSAAGTCDAAVADGASCTAASHCLPPAQCSGGVCKLPDPSTCH